MLYNGVRQGFFSPVGGWNCVAPALRSWQASRIKATLPLDTMLIWWCLIRNVPKPGRLDALHEQVDWTPYEGQALFGKVEAVWLRGKHAIHDGACLLQAGEGQFVARRF
ncbi:MAG UNVERIFIED_CONTAM: hypothetical protein LVT10_01920 [Anaerolineae bacterium]